MRLTLLEIEAFAMLHHRQDRRVMECAPRTGYGEARDRLIEVGLVTKAGHSTRKGQRYAKALRSVEFSEPRKRES